MAESPGATASKLENESDRKMVLTHLNVKEAVKIAKDWVVAVLAEEGVSNVGLEEVNFDDAKQSWLITIGFSRPWNSIRNAFTAISGEPAPSRTYRIISVSDADGKVTSMQKPNSEE
ncbi:MAG: hypothetical protein ABSG46_06315 [Candidatus Binataceae bacterium]